MRMRQLIAIQFIIVIAYIVVWETSSKQFSEIYFLIAMSLYFSITYYLLLNLKHLQNNNNRDLLQELSTSITTLIVNYEKVSLFLAAQTSDLHLKKLGGWALDIDTAQLLTRIVKITSPTNVLEFGSGASTVILGRSLRDLPNSIVYSVDESFEFFSETQKFLKLNKLNNIKLIHSPLQNNWFSEGPLHTFPIFDLIFIDGPKENRIGSINFIEAHSNKSTIFVIDDYGSIETDGLVEALTGNGKRGLKIFSGDKNIALIGEPFYLRELVYLL
jgi:predicted O-methyltransferase YrrM